MRDPNWRDARRDSSTQAPDPAITPEAVIQVYAARTVGVKGVLGVHTWIAVKRSGATKFTRYEVIGWGVDRGLSAVRIDRTGPDNYWFGRRPDLLVDVRGDGVDAQIDRVEAAVRDYPYPSSYRTWPGPNSNTFTAFVGRAVPELRLDLPPTAVGKDFLPGGAPVGITPSGTGVQLSLLGSGRRPGRVGGRGRAQPARAHLRPRPEPPGAQAPRRRAGRRPRRDASLTTDGRRRARSALRPLRGSPIMRSDAMRAPGRPTALPHRDVLVSVTPHPSGGAA